MSYDVEKKRAYYQANKADIEAKKKARRRAKAALKPKKLPLTPEERVVRQRERGKAWREANKAEQRVREAAKAREYRVTHKDRISARKRAWRAANIERARVFEKRAGAKYRAKKPIAPINASLKRMYGITLADKATMLAAQGGGCALCHKLLELMSRDTHVDHCHKTKRVRGVLCFTCNRRVGVIEKAGDDWLVRAFEYTEKGGL